jgi:UDP:flavonoid glycosyltransferase YjiC (YdhE family)
MRRHTRDVLAAWPTDAMRVLIATTAGTGHFAPLVPFAVAIREAGHSVRVAAPASFAATVRRAGFDHVPLADGPAYELGSVFARLPSLSMEAANEVIVSEVFCGIDARAALPAMQAVADEWRPDLILRETAEFASYVVAEHNGIPHVQVATSLAVVEEFMQPLVDQPLRTFGAQRGWAGLAAAPHLTLVPASLEEPDRPASAPRHRFRQPSAPVDVPDLPQSWWRTPDLPLVYVTLGSVAAGIGFFPDFYRATLAALADLPIRVLLTLGEAGDPTHLEPLPPDCHVERWWPQEQVMPRATAMVTHGGFATTMLGLSSGLPMILVPLFAIDQYATARRVQAVGAGIAVEDRAGAPASVRSALERVLTDDTYRKAAKRIADEIAQLPPPSASVALLERLARDSVS